MRNTSRGLADLAVIALNPVAGRLRFPAVSCPSPISASDKIGIKDFCVCASDGKVAATRTDSGEENCS